MKLRVAYAKSRYKDTVYETPLVVTSYRDENGVARNKTIVSLAKLPRYVVKVIELALKRGDTQVLDEYIHPKEISHQSSLVVGPVFVVVSLMKQLGIFSLLLAALTRKQALAIFAIIVERVISSTPLSVMALQRQFPHDPLAYLLDAEKAPALKTWYSALARLEANRESILQALYERNPTPGQVFLYDITSSYFEGETCPLAAFGYNRDGKIGKMQVVIGVICNAQGCPIWVDVFQGNTSDQTTVKQQILNLHQNLGVTNFTFVGDRGMVTHARIEELEQDGWWESLAYITALTRQEMIALVEDENHPIQLELFDHNEVGEVQEGKDRYVLCHNPSRMERDRETRERLLKRTQAKLDMIQRHVEAGRWKKSDVIAKRLYPWLNRWGMARFFEVRYGDGTFSYSLREEELDRYQRLDGCYVIRSNVQAEHQTKEELRDRYKDLKYVEQAFRTMKTTEIHVRPIRHFHEPQVRGHIFACFLAYRILWELRQRWEAVLCRDPDTQECEAGSLREIWRALSTITLAKMKVQEKVYYKLSEEITPYIKKLLKLAKIPSLDILSSE
ncbi:IS1634 family transposase [bacterium]|nr:IS1634 family transposase [bacterium]